MTSNGPSFVEMSLANVADGELEGQFNEELMKVLETRAMLPVYKDSGGVVKCEIQMTVAFNFHIESGALLVETSANFKPPKRRSVTRAAFINSGQVLVEDAVQQDLLPNVTSIDRAKENERGD